MRLFFFLLLLVAAVSAFPKNENFLPPEDLELTSPTAELTEANGGLSSVTSQDPTNQPISPNSGSTTAAQVPAQTTTTASQPPTAKPFDVESQTFPNDVNPISAKRILQDAVQLSNQINQLSQQILILQASIDPDNSPLILDLYSMQNTSVELQNNLTSIQKELNGAIETMNPVISRYNNVSRVFNCYVDSCQQTVTTAAFTTALFTGTTPAPSCNQNFTATDTIQTSPAVSYKDQQCSLRIDATKGHIFVDFTGTDNNANFTITDLNTAAQLERPANQTLETSTTSLKIQINAGDEVFTFQMAYKYIDPCTGYCNETSTRCSVNAAGQPYCTCRNKCDQPNSDGISCDSVQCSKVYKKQNCGGDPDNLCRVIPDGNGNCNSTCNPPTDAPPSFFERWLFP